MQSIYTSGSSNYGMAGLYAPAGVVNMCSSSFNTNGEQEPFYKKSDGTIITNPTLTQTSVVSSSPLTYPLTPDNINISIQSSTSVIVQFSPVSNALYYTIYYNSLSVVTTSTHNLINGLIQHTPYIFTITATNNIGTSLPYTSLSIIPTVLPVSSPLFVTSVDNTYTMFNASFKGDLSVNQYELVYGYGSNMNTVIIPGNTDNIINYKLSLLKNINYTFTLTSSNSMGTSTSTSYYFF